MNVYVKGICWVYLFQLFGDLVYSLKYVAYSFHRPWVRCIWSLAHANNPNHPSSVTVFFYPVLQWHPVLPPSPLLFNKVTVMDGYILRIMDPKVEHLPNLLQNFGLHGGAAVYVSVVLWSAAREAALSPSADECWVCVPDVWPSLNTSSQGATCLRPSFYEKRGVVWTPLLSPVSRAPRVRQPSCTSSRRPRGSRLSSPREMGQKRLILCRMSSVSLRAPALAFLLI